MSAATLTAAVQDAAPKQRTIPATASTPADRARVDFGRLAFLAVQVAALLFVVRVLNVESAAFFNLLAYSCAGALIQYFAPLPLKKAVFILTAAVVGVIMVAQPDPAIAKGYVHYIGGAVAVGIAGFLALVFFACLRLFRSNWLRAGALLLIGGGLAYARSETALLPDAYWRVIAALLMFRLIVFAYEVCATNRKEPLTDYLCYIFLPPNFYFFLFPVVDYSTFKKGWLCEDVHRTAQRGIALITRGVIHLCLYRYIYHRWVTAPTDVNDFWTLWSFILPSYLLYTRISGQFHVAVGMLHLFGYRLPDTNNRYLLAESFTDFWRRINIYWKDFMIKVFYYPVYFRLRKKGERMALTVATLAVFLVTTFLHAYQWFWLQGTFQIKSADYVFWGILGVLVWVTVMRETSAPRRREANDLGGRARRAAGVVGVYLTISVLWSMWSCDSLRLWFDTVAYWS